MATFVIVGDHGSTVPEELLEEADGILAPGNHQDEGADLLKQLDRFDMPVFVVPGVDDLPIEEFRDRINTCNNVVNVHDWVGECDDVQVIGKGGMGGPEYPQEKEEMKGKSVKELKELQSSFEERYEKVGGLLEQATKPTVLLAHTVPYDTILDKNADGTHTGSVLVRDWILEYHPCVAVGRHANATVGKCDMNGSTVINAGNADSHTLLEVDEGVVKRLEFKK